MTKEQVQEYRVRQQAAEANELAEQRNALVQQRWLELNTLWHEAIELGLPIPEEEDVKIVRDRWAKLKGLD